MKGRSEAELHRFQLLNYGAIHKGCPHIRGGGGGGGGGGGQAKLDRCGQGEGEGG